MDKDLKLVLANIIDNQATILHGIAAIREKQATGHSVYTGLYSNKAKEAERQANALRS